MDACWPQLVQFEAFRDLVKYASKGLPEEEGIEAAQEESLVIRAQARVEATAAFRIQSHQALPGDSAMAAGGVWSVGVLERMIGFGCVWVHMCVLEGGWVDVPVQG
eukprot:scaffold117413_cov19-Tisochrysis_lutea.AAC.2